MFYVLIFFDNLNLAELLLQIEGIRLIFILTGLINFIPDSDFLKIIIMSEYSSIILEIDERIATITINRAKALNALNKDVFNDLDAVLDDLRKESIDGIIITGSGEKAFAAGADISEFSSLGLDGAAKMSQRGHDVFFKIEQYPKPIIAAVNGFALGGGCELALACHMRIAGAKARFGQPEVNLGIVPGYGGSQRLIQLIGKGKAMELLLTGNMIGADEAVSLGLANYSVEVGEEQNKAKELIQLIGKKAPLAIKETINLVNAYFDKSKEGFSEEVNTFGVLSNTADFKEGASAFLEKRKAKFTGE